MVSKLKEYISLDIFLLILIGNLDILPIGFEVYSFDLTEDVVICGKGHFKTQLVDRVVSGGSSVERSWQTSLLSAYSMYVRLLCISASTPSMSDNVTFFLKIIL